MRMTVLIVLAGLNIAAAKIAAPPPKSGRFEARITVDRGAASQEKWNKFSELLRGSRFRLRDPQGREATIVSQEFTGQQPRVLTVRNWPQNPKEPATFKATGLRWEMPTETRDLEIPLEFQDLPLP